jgi:hypothetical protein
VLTGWVEGCGGCGDGVEGQLNVDRQASVAVPASHGFSHSPNLRGHTYLLVNSRKPLNGTDVRDGRSTKPDFVDSTCACR